MGDLAAGIFIGVDNYEHLESRKRLMSAGASAQKLYSYFKDADPYGNWMLRVDQQDWIARRINVLSSLIHWIKSVASSSSALIYFAGHGSLTYQGMVLAPRDFIETIPYDSGIPLQRLIDIIIQYAQEKTCWVIIVDACRTGSHISNPLTLSEYVSIIYTCHSGTQAFETSHGSIFTEEFLRAMQKAITEDSNGVATANLSSILSLTRLSMSAQPKTVRQNLSWVGNSLDEIYVPIMELNVSASKTVCMNTVLRSRLLSAEFLSEKIERIVQLSRSFGFEINEGDGIEIINIGDKKQINVALPGVPILTAPHAFFAYLMSKCYSVFFELEIIWPHSFSLISVHSLCSQCDLRIHIRNQNDVDVFWESNETFNGFGKFNGIGKAFTCLVISCQNLEGFNQPLDRLSKTLYNIYDFLCLQTERVQTS